MRYLIAILALFSLAACSPPESVQRKRAAPEIVDLANVKIPGCTAQFVDRGYLHEGFYVVRCAAVDTAAVTRNYQEQSGKSTIDRQQLVIIQEQKKEETRLEAQILELQQQQTRARAKREQAEATLK